MDAVRIQFEKYEKIAEESFFVKKGKIVNVVGLTIESAGPDSKLGDVCYIFPEDKSKRPIMAEVVGFKEGKTQLMPYDLTDGIGIGNIVENSGETLQVKISDELLGKTLEVFLRSLPCQTRGLQPQNRLPYPVAKSS